MSGPETPTSGAPTRRSPGGVRIEHTTTDGTFSLDGGTWEVTNNVWIVGDDDEVILIDAPHDATPIQQLIGDRRLSTILLTHSHDDHVSALPGLLEAYPDVVVALSPADREVWALSEHPRDPDHATADGDLFRVGDVAIRAAHTPGHSPGATSFIVDDLGVVFTGDTLFAGGPGATGRSFSDFPTIIESITDQLLTLPVETLVLTGHGDNTTIGAEAPNRQAWIDRGH